MVMRPSIARCIYPVSPNRCQLNRRTAVDTATLKDCTNYSTLLDRTCKRIRMFCLAALGGTVCKHAAPNL